MLAKEILFFINPDVDLNILTETIHAMTFNPSANLNPSKDLKITKEIIQNKGIKAMRQVPTEPAYDVTLTLMLPQPHFLKAEWDVSAAVKDYLDPLVDELKDIVELRIRSQILYMTSMRINPKWSSNYKHYSLPEKQLPLTINSIEAKLGSFVSTRPSLHFIVYIPSDLQTPLYIHRNDGTPLESNSFLIPRWGGIMIHNPPEKLIEKKGNSSLPLTFQIDSQWVMKTVIFHLHKLFPIPSLNEKDVKYTEQIYANSLTDWQINGLARARVLSYLNSIKITLQSLCDLVGEISNMVVSDEVAGWVWSAVDDWKLCLDASQEGRLEEATAFCKRAFVSSDAAFFHPSMLALLYFPDNQKYAIYVPLFLPVSIPVVLSFRTVFKLLNFKAKKD
ncbi:GPI transamidase component PIG-S [Armadillidium nasatum]|uniref:GPI transamidase component PIG-S n=1 Tax=Armadillidium nasatum TaxID=96803 RepID=A0A5N5T0A6_9CRUS|nr:GPI transamidase component PIG-S [Armadillidium nasatum]